MTILLYRSHRGIATANTHQLHIGEFLGEQVIWLRRVHRQKQFFVSAPIVIGGIAGLSILQDWGLDWIVAVLAFISSLFPALSDLPASEDALAELMDRMDIARNNSITPPESPFKEAQRKIAEGHYDFSIDQPSAAT